MATIVLSAVGAAAGASIGGGVFGLSSVVIGRAIGATVGRVIDQRIMGSGSEAVETGRVDRFRLNGASEGAVIPQIYGRSRVAGQVIWATRFRETKSTSGGGGGKGSPPKPKVTKYSYSVSLAIALCEGEITRVGRVWADGEELARDDLNLRVYSGAQDQLPDPKIQAVEGADNVPAFRGVAYCVLEDLDLGQFGNRVPQFSFEVMRPAQSDVETATDLARGIRALALIPGTGEYALATTPVYFDKGIGNVEAANANTPSGKTDFATSIETLSEELPNCGSVSMIVSWFGDDLRCAQSSIQPKVEQKQVDGKGMPWIVSGIGRGAAELVPQLENRPVYGGTPADRSVIEAIQEIKTRGKDVVFYPFILMEQMAGNGLTDPWSGSAGQPVLPWRGRMTLSVAPGQSGSPDQTATATSEVNAFFGAAQPADFSIVSGNVVYSGPAEWSYRRFILHYAYLCVAAGGVASFCIGSEMRGLTQIRGAGNSFPAVDAMRLLAGDVRSVLGAGTKIGYAADWSEYFGYQPQDGSGDVFFNLDPLWADDDIDFIGIDNYMPLSDWRDGDEHADADWGSIYNTEYLKANIAGGEGYDWFYHSKEAEAVQNRSPIQDGAYGEHWIYRYKDLKGWWSNDHFDRLGGVKVASSSPWVPGSKPIWFTEFGCAAIDKGTNQPNKFLDPKSSESSLPKYSDGRRDDLIQMQYLKAQFEYWALETNNPVSDEYDAPMVDMDHAHVWAWDARPYPFFPLSKNLWSDGDNYYRGHWLNGRTTSRALADVVEEICARSGVDDIDVVNLYGYLRGYSVSGLDGARSALQPLMLAFGFEAIERDGGLIFRSRDGRAKASVTPDQLALSGDLDTAVENIRAPEAETVGRLRLNFIDADGDYDGRTEEAIFPDETARAVSQSETSLLLTSTEGRGIVERWLAESRVARDTVRFSLAPSGMNIGAGDVVVLDNAEDKANYRIDRVSQTEARLFEAVRVEPEVYQTSDAVEAPAALRVYEPAVPVFPVFLDLPLLTGDEVEHAPHLAVTSTSWPGSVAVFGSPTDSGYELNTLLSQPAVIGTTQSLLSSRAAGVLDRGQAVRVQLSGGALSSVSNDDLMNGANVAAIGDGSSGNWEIFQFAEANLVDEGVYDLSMRLRGQAGSDALASTAWPPGSIFVLLDGAPSQINLAASARGLSRHYRIGPSRKPLDDQTYTHMEEAFDGIGLRPLAPVHLRAVQTGAGDFDISWIRRTRIDGDSWQSVEVPLGEESESYQVQVLVGGTVVRTTTVLSPGWTYSGAMQATDGASGLFNIQVAQISGRFGPGLFRRIDVNE